MNQQAENVTVVCEAPNAKLFHMINNQRNRIGVGIIKLCWLKSAGVYFLSLDQFCQNLYPSTPLVTITSEKGVSILFPNVQQGLNGLFIPDEPSKFFCNQLSQIIQMIPYNQAISIPQFKTSIDLHCKDIEQNPIENDIVAIGYIQQGGEAAKTGFMWLGGKMAIGINKGGNYINSKIEKQEYVEVSTETKLKVAIAKESATQGANMTVDYLSQLFRPVVEKVKEVKKDINQHIDQSQNQVLKDGRQITIASWDATGNALSGLGSALSQVGDSVGTNTRQCVETRYGADVKNTYT